MGRRKLDRHSTVGLSEGRKIVPVYKMLYHDDAHAKLCKTLAGMERNGTITTRQAEALNKLLLRYKYHNYKERFWDLFYKFKSANQSTKRNKLLRRLNKP